MVVLGNDQTVTPGFDLAIAVMTKQISGIDPHEVQPVRAAGGREIVRDIDHVGIDQDQVSPAGQGGGCAGCARR
ncbi:hypothetical protein GLI01_12070 [Gluconacetobacter liquefaciens]|nr:hypothetical protein GLI01_12070 [Gluconacetobacter liquefaciens]